MRVNQNLLGLRVLLAALWEEGAIQTLKRHFCQGSELAAIATLPRAAEGACHRQRSPPLTPLPRVPAVCGGRWDPVSGASGKAEALRSELLLWSVSPYRVEHR